MAIIDHHKELINTFTRLMKRFFRFYALTLTLTFLSTGTFAQNKSWLVKMQDPDVNFWELQKEFNDYWKDRTDYKGNGYKVFKRWEYINETRVLPDGKLQPADYVLKEYEKYMAEAAQLKSASGTWSIVGPTIYPTNNTGQPTGKGRVNVITFHPTDVNTLFIGAPSGGIWKSVNGGANWTNLSANIPYLGVSAILIDPSNPDIIYIGTGDRDSDDAPGVGVYKSTDGGVSWVPMNVGMGNTTVGMMLMHPSDPNTILAATYTGIFKTTNGGVTWSQTLAGDFRDIKFKPGNPDVVYATRIITPAQYYRSTDNGTTWGQVTTPVSGVGSRMVIGVSPANPDYVYLVQIKSSDANFKALLRSVDSGLTFTEQSNAPNIFDYLCDGSGTASQATYDLIIDVDRTNAEIVYVGSINSWKSVNGGVTWSPVTHWVGSNFAPGNPTANCAVSVHADHHWYQWSPLHSPARLYLGHDGGIAYTADGGTTWTDITTDLAIGQVYKVGQSAQTANNIIAGFQDNGVSATNDGVNFTTVGGGDGGECAINYNNANFCYRESQLGNLTRSSAGLFGSYSNIISAINDQAAFIAPYMLHRTNPGTMFFGRENVWRSTNVDAIPSGSVTWETISSFAAGTTIRVVEQSPANLNIVYISRGSGSGSAMYRSDNANAAANAVVWNAITKPGGLTATDIKAHPVNENIVFATAGMQVFKSTDKGITWADITGNLPALFINCLVLDKDANEGIYIGNQTGVWYKDADITEWVLFSSGLPPVDVRELEIYYDANPDNSRITASTYGRGIWQSDLIEVNAINPSGLAAVAISTTQIDLSWTLNASNNNVLIATSPTTIFGVPVDGTAYTAGNSLPGGGTVIYVGNMVNFSHTGLTAGSDYCYKIWSVNGSNQYSAGLPPVCARTFSHNWTGNVNTDWFNAGNWGPGTVPTILDGAYIPAGRPNYPLINAAGARCSHLTIEPGASVSMDASTSYILQVSGDWINNGTFNRGVGTVEFNGNNALQNIAGASTTDFYVLRVDKGSANNILDAVAQITLNAAVDAPLALISGTFRLSNAASTITAITANGQTTANALGLNKRIWVSAGTLNVNSRWRINHGELRITGGTVNIGNANNMELDYLNSGAIILEGGALNVSAGIWGNASNQSSTGIIAISGGTMTVGVFSNGFARGMLEAGPNCIFIASGGTIVIQRSNGHTQQYLNQSTISSVTGGLLQIGNAATPSSQTIRINSTVPVYNLTVNATNSPTAQLLTNNLTVLNDLTISGGTLNANNLNLNVGRHWTNGGSFIPGTGVVTFDGTVNQNLGGVSPTTFNNLTLNNANGLTLNGSVNTTVNGTLALNAGVITTGSNTVIIPSTGAVSRTSGHIFGKLQKHVASGAGISRTFEIGDVAASGYTPVSVTFASVSTPGNVIAQSVSGDHPQIGSATLNASKSVNRYWSLTNSGTAFTTYDAVFNFLTADLDPAVNTSNLVGGKYNAPNWTYPAIGARTANSTEITGVASFSDFQLAEPSCVDPDVPGLTATVNPTCSGQPTNLSIATGNLNGAADWQWYSGSCGGTPVGTGSSVNVSPAGTTTYFARGEGGCVVTPGACGSISITVNANPIAAPTPSPASVCVGSILNISGNAGGGSGNYTAHAWTCSGCSGLVALSNVGTPTLQVDAVGGAPGSATLTYQVTDNNGCTASATVALTINARPVPTFTASPGASVCVNTGVTYTTQSGQSNYIWSVPGTAGVDYTITSGGIGSTDNTVTLQWLSSGSKTVTVNYTDANGCTGANPASNTNTVNALPTTSNAGSNQTICANGNAALSANTPVVGTGLWSVVSGPNTSPSQFGNPSLPSVNFVPAGGPGVYLIRWTISNPPCPASTSELTVTVVATPTFANAGSAQSICANSSATMAANTPVVGTGTWSISAGPNLSSSQFSNVNDPAAMFTPTTPGIYSLAWSIANPPCMPSVDAVTITVNTLPATPTITPSGPTTFCTGGSVQLTSSAASAYLWSTTETTQSITVTTSGSYTVQITDANGCTATSAPTDVTVLEQPVANAGTDADECSLNTTLAAVPSVGTGTWTYTGPGTATFAPDANDPAAVATVTAYGAYTFTWTEENGICTDDDIVTINFNAPPAVTLNDPADVCLTGADMNFTGTPTDANGSFTTTAGAGFTDNGDGTAVLDVSVAGIGTYDVTYTYTDGNGCQASETVSVSVTSCALNFTGRVIWEADHLTTMTGVKDATTTLSGDDNDTDITNVTGNYSLDATMGTEFEIKPVKNKPMPFAINGLTAGDASRIQQHVIGAFPFTDPYKLIAADVNKSNSVTAQDASLVSQAVLGNPIAQGFFINTTWRFVPKAYVFPVPASPWGFPEKIVLTGVSGSLTGQDFIGSKLGDVNNTANPANLAPSTLPDLVWKVQDRVLEQDETFVAEFCAYNFDALLAFQFGLNFDPTKIQLLTIETIPGSPMDTGNFGAYNAANGEIRALLAMAQALSVPAGTPVFRLKFKVLQSDMKLSEVLFLDELVLPAIAYDSAFAESGVELQYSTVTGTHDQPGAGSLQLFQNRPNPFNGTTTIGFILPDACEAQLRIFDVSGRLLMERVAQYPAGKQEEVFDLTGFTGVLYYELVTSFGTLGKRMLLTGK